MLRFSRRFAGSCVARQNRHSLLRQCLSVQPAFVIARSSPCGAAVSIPVRHQSTTAVQDKKFHCSVCNKPFRLERAAQVHLEQAHGGTGTIEVGPGPGYSEPQKTSIQTPQEPPSKPTVVTPTRQREENDDDEPWAKNRPTPKPLHQPTVEVPPVAMDELLAVWDKIGVARVPGFVHSSMVMKVFAARPVDPASLPSSYEVQAPAAVGSNPFAAAAAAQDDAQSSRTESQSLDVSVDISTPFAFAGDTSIGPFCVAATLNPLSKSQQAQPREEAKKPTVKAPVATKVEAPQAPVTPFGQLPMFGQAAATPTPTRQVPAAVEGSVASPFSSSPFAAASSPFSSASAASPFAAAASPFESPSVSSPFAAAGAPASSVVASPFASSTASLSPFATTPSAPDPLHASPFAEEPPAPLDSSFSGSPVTDTHAALSVPPPVEVKLLPCSTCGKTFRTDFDLAQHNKNKHNIPIPEDKRKPSSPRRKRELPDLPAYVPSPVDLGTTTPFGSSLSEGASWTEASLVMHAHTASNITLLGQVADVSSDGLQVTVAVADGKEVELVSVKLFVAANLKRQSSVLVVGSLRLVPEYEAAANKHFLNAVVHVAAPMGSITVLE